MSLLERESDGSSFEELLKEFEEKRHKQCDEEEDEMLHIKDYFKSLGDAAKCRFGDMCERRSTCTFYHGNDDSLKRLFCECTSTSCNRPHPNRKRGEKRPRQDTSITDTSITCFQCGGPHHIRNCRYVKCNKCFRYGHMSNECRN